MDLWCRHHYYHTVNLCMCTKPCPPIDHGHLPTPLTCPTFQGSNRDSTMLDKWEHQYYPHRILTLRADHWDLYLSCPKTDQAIAVPWCWFLWSHVITTSHICFQISCMHSWHTQQCCGSSTSTTLESKNNLIHPLKGETISSTTTAVLLCALTTQTIMHQ